MKNLINTSEIEGLHIQDRNDEICTIYRPDFIDDEYSTTEVMLHIIVLNNPGINVSQLIPLYENRPIVVLRSWGIETVKGDIVFLKDYKFASILCDNIDDVKNMEENRFELLYNSWL